MTVNKLEPDNGTPNDELFTVAGMFDGSLYKLLLRMALPMFVGMLTQVTYAIADIFWLSHIDVTNSGIIAGVGLVSPLEWGYLPSPTAFKSVWDLCCPAPSACSGWIVHNGFCRSVSSSRYSLRS